MTATRMGDLDSEGTELPFVDDVEEALDLLVSLGRGPLLRSSPEIDAYYTRDRFLDVLADSDRLFGQRPGGQETEALHVRLQELYLAAFDVDWHLAGPWLLEDAIEAVEELRLSDAAA